MKRYAILLVGLLFSGLIFTNAHAQQLKGVATYKASSAIKLQMDSTRMSPETMAQLQSQLRKQMQKEFTLSFDNISSTWKEVESLGSGPASAEAGGARIVLMGSNENAILYKNTQDGKIEESTDLMGKPFLIKDDLPTYQWILSDETKQIGHYTCQKAIYKTVVDSRKFSSGMMDMDVIKDTIAVEAWFTTEIPVSHGPANIWGLPGLILELNTGAQTYLCSKIVLNPKEEVVIERPKKGKVVSRSEFQALQEEKMQEMMKRYSGGPGENKMEIRIGG